MLPPELLSMVCSNLLMPDLGNLRLVCQSYEEAAVPFLFDQVFISFDMEDLQNAKRVILRFGQHVRTLVFSSVILEDYNESDFLEAYWEARGDDEYSLVCSDCAEYAWGLYENALKLQKEALISGVCQAHLSLALCRLSKLQKVNLTDTISSRSIAKLEVSHVGACPNGDCKDDEMDHFQFTRQAGLATEGPYNPWRAMLLALSITQRRISEIAMECEDGADGVSLNTAAFEMLAPALADAKICMQGLTKLRLDLDVSLNTHMPDERTYFVHRNVPELLKAAVNLECLSLDAYDEADLSLPGRMSIFGFTLGKCEFPKLRSLILGFFYSTDAELLRLLKNSPDLKHLVLGCHHLTAGTWEQLASEVKKNLSLKYVKLDQLYGGFPAPEDEPEFMDYFGEVQEFFVGKGKNPFTKKAIEQHLADRESGRERNIGPSTLECYRMFR